MLIKWNPPPLGKWKLNTDGASRGAQQLAARGGVIRDHEGNWMHGFTSNLGSCGAMESELWAIWYGLRLAWDRGYRELLVEMDSKEVLSLLTVEEVTVSRQANICFLCKEILKKDWSVSLIHVYREANCVANELAAICLKRSEIFFEFQELQKKFSSY